MQPRSLSEDSEGSGTASEIVAHIVLWTFICLLLSCAVITLRDRAPLLPMSGLMMLVGVLVRSVGIYFGQLRGAVELMDNVDADAILLVFLPALIAECAISLDWYTFKRESLQISLLATTAVVTSSTLTAVAVKYVLQYDQEFDWYSAMMLGAIFSATDHVSVVAILKDVKADDRLQTLMQGETLLNDGSVLVLFTAMMSSAVHETKTASELVSLFFRLSLGGIALGIAFSVALSLWLYKVVNHVILETLLTVVCAYLLFFTAELKAVNASGGLATVAFGLYMSAFGKTFISPRIEQSVHQFWKFFGTIAEALILILGGSLLGSFFFNNADLRSTDVGALFALFALLHVARALTVAIHWPVLRLLGYGLTWRQAVILTFGAVKGTISIALALLVYENEDFPDRLANLTLFWAVGTSALYILFDSTALHYLVGALGMEKLTHVQENMLLSFTTSLLQSTNNELKKMKDDADFAQTKWDEVENDCGFELTSNSQSLLLSMVAATTIGRKMLKTTPTGFSTQQEVIDKFSETASISAYDIILETRRRFFTTLKKLYWHRFENGQCFRYSALTLIESADRSLDAEHEEMGDWKYIRSVLLPPRRMKALSYCCDFPVVGSLCKKVAFWHLVRAYDIARNFIKVHREAKELLEEMKVDIDTDIFEKVVKESECEIFEASKFLASQVTDIHPEVCHFVQTLQARSRLLYAELGKVEEAFSHGIITKLEYAELFAYVKKRIVSLEDGQSPSQLDLSSTLKMTYLFGHLNASALSLIADSSSSEFLQPGQQIHCSIHNGVYLILRGRLREVVEDREIEHAVGDAVGSENLVSGEQLPAVEIEAEAAVATKVALLPTNLLQQFVSDPEFERKLWFLYARKALAISNRDFGALGNLPPEKLNVVFMHSVLVKYQAGETIPVQFGTILLCGALTCGINAFAYLAGDQSRQECAHTPCVTLVFNDDLGQFVSSSHTDLHSSIARFNLRNKPHLLRMSAKVKVNMKELGLKVVPPVTTRDHSSKLSAAPSEGNEPLLLND